MGSTQRRGRVRCVGVVVDRRTQRGVGGLRVEAWEAGGELHDLLAVARTDAEGSFAMALRPEDLAPLGSSRGTTQLLAFPGRRGILAYFRVLDGTDVLLDTRERILWRLEPAEAGFRLTVIPGEHVALVERLTPYVVRGRLAGVEGPLADTTVRAFDRNLDVLTALGAPTATDAQGRYEIQYEPSELGRSGKVLADLVLRAFDDRDETALLAESPERCHAPPTAVVDLVVRGERYFGPSLHERLRSRLTDVLGTRPLADLADGDRDALACTADSDTRDIDALVGAARLARAGVAVSEEVLFALLRRGLPADREALLSNPLSVIRSELQGALDANLLSQRHHRDLEATIDLWVDAAASFLLEPRAGKATLKELLAVAGLMGSTDQQQFAKRYVRHEGPAESFWRSLDLPMVVREHIQLAMQWAALARAHLPLVRHLNHLRTTGAATAFHDLAAFDENDWRAMLDLEVDGWPVGAPDDLPARTPEERKTAYARLLALTMASAFPGAAFRARVQRFESDEIKGFFAAHPDFELRKSRLSSVSLDLTPAGKTRLQAMERLYSVIPLYEPIQKLLSLGIGSAHAVREMGPKMFVKKTSGFFSEKEAMSLFGSATWVAAAAAAIHAKLAPVHHSVLLHVLPDWLHPSSGASAIPDWSTLLGNPGGCACKHCASVLGPAAYLVDLLQFLDRYPSTVSKGNGQLWTARDVLLGRQDGANKVPGRRPDIARLLLTCENAHTPLPTIDLVNEILAFRVAADAKDPDPTLPETIETKGEPQALLAMPAPPVAAADLDAWQATLATAFSALRSAVHPFTLPVDLFAEETRHYLGHLGVARTEILVVLDTGTAEARAQRLAQERLGTTATGWLCVTQADVATDELAARWGLPAQSLVSQLQQVPVFLRQAGTSFEELQTLLDTVFVNGKDGQGAAGEPQLAIAPELGCDVAMMSLPLLSQKHLDRIHRFLRLRHLTALSIADTDRAVTAIGESAVLLEQITTALEVGRRLDLRGAALFALWGAMDTHEPLGPSLFRTIFLNRTVNSPDAPAFRALLDNPSPESADALAAHVPSLLQALAISAEDLALLTDGAALARTLALPSESLVVPEGAALTLGNLSRLLRTVLFCRAARLPLRDYLLLRSLSGLTPLTEAAAAASPWDTLAFLDLVETWRAAGVSTAELQYVLRDVDLTTRPLVPAPEIMSALLDELAGAVDKLTKETTTVDDPDGEKTRSLLSALLPGAADSVFPILAGTSPQSVEEQRTAVAVLRVHAEEDIETVKDKLAGGATAALASAKERFAYVALRLTRQVLARRLVVERLASEMNIDPNLADVVMSDVLRSPVEPERPAILDFLPAVRLSANAPSPEVLATTLRAAMKHARLLQAVRLTSALPPEGTGDLAWAYAPDIANPSLRDLPMSAPTAPAFDLLSAKTRFAMLVSLWRRVALRDRLQGGAAALREILEHVPDASNLDVALRFVADRTGWNVADLSVLAAHFGWDAPALATDDALSTLEKAMALCRRLGTSAAQVLSFRTLDAPNEAPPGELSARDLADAARRLAKAKHTDEQWKKLARDLRAPLRMRTRDALVSYLLPRHKAAADDLFADLLIDVEMSPCALTSRIVEATNAVQAFVNRSLLRIEPQVVLDGDAASEWEWRKAYRVWEANRKVFLYPETWIRPELRDDATPLYKTLVTRLRSGELTAALAEDAVAQYLQGLHEVSRLDVCAAAYEAETQTDHLLGRTRGAPHRYFHRRREGSRGWTPWEPAAIDIEGEHVILLLVSGELLAIWPVFVARADSFQPDPAESAQHWEIRLASSTYGRGAWGPKRISEDSIVVGPALADGNTAGFPKEAFSLVPDKPSSGASASQVRLICGLAVSFYEPAGTFTDPVALRVGSFTFDPCGGGWWMAEQRPDELGNLYTALTNPEDFDLLYLSGNLPTGALLTESTALQGTEPRLILNKIPVGPPSGRKPFQLMMTAPSLFRVVSPAAPTALDTYPYDRLVYNDQERTFHARREDVAASWHARGQAELGPSVRLSGPLLLLSQLDSPVSAWGEGTLSSSLGATANEKWRFEPLYHPFVCDFTTRLRRGGVAGLLGWTGNVSDSAQFRRIEMADDYKPNFIFVVSPFPAEEVDFSFGGSYSAYNWELFFHVPLTIALALQKEERYEAARRWFHFIFDPTTGSSDSAPKRFWKFRPFYENDHLATMQAQLSVLAASSSTAAEMAALFTNDPAASAMVAEITAQIEAWQDDPFNPHLLARMRIAAYQKVVVMAYLENLLAWGDSLFRQDTMESLHEALQLYLLAASILGPRPVLVDHEKGASPAKTYAGIEPDLDAFSNAAIALEPVVPPKPSGGGSSSSASPPLPTIPLYFCVPPNDKLLGYWDLVADRLFKLRNCMNIEGVARQVPLFAPPIDPSLLVRAKALGVRLDSVLSDLSAPTPLYRFARLHPKAMELAVAAQSLGSSLLLALEKQDGEALAVLRNDHEAALLVSEVAVREDAVREARATLDGLQRGRLVVEERHRFYSQIAFLNADERSQLDNLDTAADHQSAANVADAAASVLFAIPDALTGGAGLASPVAAFVYGGKALGHAAQAGARAASAIAGMYTNTAAKAGLMGGYERRRDDWRLQAELAKRELAQVDKQIVAAEIRLAITEAELESTRLRKDQNRAIAEFYRSKFTSTDLYLWMATELAAEYSKAYQLAYDMAKRAERALQLERGDSTLQFLSFGYWDHLKKGLLAGERLARDLRAMEAAYLAQATRERELTKHVSLATLDAAQLVELRDTGTCSFTIPEAEFDADHPGHYFRRLKTVALTLPTVVGPNEGVHAELTLTKSTLRKTALLTNGTYAKTPGEDDPRFVVDPRVEKGLVTSTAQADAGLFEVNLKDEMLLPFEGAGAESEWTLRLRPETNPFALTELTDVVLHLRYTARDGGDVLGGGALDHLRQKTHVDAAPERRTLTRLVSAKREAQVEWNAFVAGDAQAGSHELILSVSQDLFGRLFGVAPLVIVEVVVSCVFAAKYVPAQAGPALAVEVFVPGAQTPLLPTGTLPLRAGEPSFARAALVPVRRKDDPQLAPWRVRIAAPFGVPASALKNALLAPDLFEDLSLVFRYTEGDAP